jgi:hypothetical protein
MNSPLFKMVVDGFLSQGYEIKCELPWIVTVIRWKLVHKEEDLKIIESMVNIIIPDEEYPNDVYVRFSYYDK